jgi:hypothetical protein
MYQIIARNCILGNRTLGMVAPRGKKDPRSSAPQSRGWSVAIKAAPRMKKVQWAAGSVSADVGPKVEVGYFLGFGLRGETV